MKLKYIIFGLENCEIVTIDGKYVGYFLATDIATSIERVACNAIMELTFANKFAIEIHKNGNKEHDLGFGEKTTAFDRLSKYSDICNIEFVIEDHDGSEKKYEYILDYEQEHDILGEDNKFQTSFIAKPGHLYIHVGKDSNAKEFFEVLNPDDEEYAHFRFQMYDVEESDEE